MHRLGGGDDTEADKFGAVPDKPGEDGGPLREGEAEEPMLV